MAHRAKVPKAGFPTLISNSFEMKHVKKLPMQEWVKVLGVDVIRLPEGYKMAGRKTHTEEVLGFKMNGKDYEIHFDENLKINSVYLVWK